MKPSDRLAVAVVGAMSLVVLLAGCTASSAPVGPKTAGEAPVAAEAPASEQPVEYQIGEGKRIVPVLPEGIDGYAVPAIVSEPPARYAGADRGAATAEALGLVLTETPTPKRLKSPRAVRVDSDAASPPRPDSTIHGGDDSLGNGIGPGESPQPLAPPFTTTFPSTDFGDNIPNNPPGFLFIPPDSSGAAGPDHVVSVVNTSIQFHTKAGVGLLDSVPGAPITGVSLSSFFAPLVPVNATFDPKVIYDQHAGRFVVVTLERTDVLLGDPTDDSRILVAVSDDADPTGTWFYTAIASKVMIGGLDRWADYPGFAVDEEAVYLTMNMFAFFSGGGTFGGTRIWIIDKFAGAGGGFYGGGTATVGLFDPVTGSAFASTMQPAHVFGLPSTASPNVGTWLTMFSGLTGSGFEFLQVIRVDDPITFGSTTFVGPLFVSMGNIDDLGGVLPDAPQFDVLGDGAPSPPRAIETNDRRTLHSVWRGNKLYVTTTIDPEAGDPNDGDATAHWVELDTTTPGSPTLVDQGDIGGEDIPDISGSDSKHTFFPAIAVTSGDDIAIGFSASGSTIHPGSYYTTHLATSAAGSNTGSTVLSAGTDEYVRTFDWVGVMCDSPPAQNRWGDYSGAAVDPVDGCFWIYNQHTAARGIGTLGGCNGAPGTEDGFWATSFGKACACNGTEALTSGAWKQVSMPCDPGTLDTVADIFGDDLSGTYDTDWMVYRRDESIPAYVKLATTDSLAVGEGYWLKSNLGSQSVSMGGASNTLTDIPLTGVAAAPPAGCASSAGQCNKVGHPHNFDVCWADVIVVDGASTFTLAGADPSGICQTTGGATCRMSRIAHKWTGASYAPFDGVTPGMEGTLVPWDGFWVSANKPGIELRIPATPGGPGLPCGAPALTEGAALSGRINATNGWHIRLTAESGAMVDRSNVFGQLADSIDGYDIHDLRELDAFGDSYLTVVFPHPEWGSRAGDYASDYHGLPTGPERDAWDFEVRSSDPSAQMLLRWEGSAAHLSRSVLVDAATGQSIWPRPDGNYAFTMLGPTRSFTWHLLEGAGGIGCPPNQVVDGDTVSDSQTYAAAVKVTLLNFTALASSTVSVIAGTEVEIGENTSIAGTFSVVLAPNCGGECVSDAQCGDDGAFCNGAESCNLTTNVCESSGDPCAGGAECNDTCDESADSCFSPAATACGSSADDQCLNPDSCDGAGVCEANDEADGTACDDGVLLTIDDQCTAGVCGGTAVECVSDAQCGDDGAFCNGAESCNLTTNVCESSGDPCAGGAECNDTCDESADSCFSPAATACGSSADDQCLNPDSCDGAGVCEANDEADGTACDDGVLLTIDDQCTAGVCGGTAVECVSDAQCGDDGAFCNGAESCNLTTNVCESSGDPCAGGAECNDTCDESADSCFSPAATACGSSADDQCLNPDSCDGAGVCEANDEADGTACDDGVLLTIDDQCTAGACGGTAVECVSDAQCGDDGAFCNGAESCNLTTNVCESSGDPCAGGAECNDTCDESADSCFSPAATACGSSADDQCLNPDSCDGAGVCEANDEADGTACDDGVLLTIDDQCTAGVCGGTAVECVSDAQCGDDGAFCNGAESCNLTTNVCESSGDPCAGGAECNDTCDESADSCFSPAATACGSSADDQCLNPDSCDGAGVCEANDEADGTACDDGVLLTIDDQCTAGACGGTAVECVSDAQCGDDGAFCNGAESCNLTTNVCESSGDPCAGGAECNDTCDESADSCFSPAATACGSSADDQCLNPDSCDGAGVCEANDEADGTACDDGVLLTIDDQCTAGACGGTAVECVSDAQCGDDGAFCNGAESCNLTTNVCESSGDPCAGGAECNDTCDESADSCFSPAATACGSSADDQCLNPDSCDGAGVCEANDEADGTACDNGLCIAGVCVNDPPPPPKFA